MKKRKYNLIEKDGTECSRCGTAAETREHLEITNKILSQPYYYSRWYRCRNYECKTTTFMLEKWKVWNKNGAANHLKDVLAHQEDLNRIRSLF